MSIILTRTQLLLLSISNVQEPQLCLPRFWAPQGVSLSRAENAPQQAVSVSFCGSYALVFVCLAWCHVSFVFSRASSDMYGGDGWSAQPQQAVDIESPYPPPPPGPPQAQTAEAAGPGPTEPV